MKIKRFYENKDNSDLIGKKCKRKGSNTTWEIWGADDEEIAIMSYSQYKPMSRRINIDTFNKNWEIVTGYK